MDDMNRQLSYEELVDHIVNNKPVPNVVSVPNITLDPSMRTESLLKPRVKPWERKAQGATVEEPQELIQKAKEITEHVESVNKTQSFESLSRYYAIEAEFEKQLQHFMDGSGKDATA